MNAEPSLDREGGGWAMSEAERLFREEVRADARPLLRASFL